MGDSREHAEAYGETWSGQAIKVAFDVCRVGRPLTLPKATGEFRPLVITAACF